MEVGTEGNEESRCRVVADSSNGIWGLLEQVDLDRGNGQRVFYICIRRRRSAKTGVT